MNFSEGYKRQVSLLLDVLPLVAKRKVFALKGGTAINFFFRDRPRLSVDIDLHYLPDNNRDKALEDIRENMEVLKQDIYKSLPGATVLINPATYHAQVRHANASIKIEPNSMIRGKLLPPVEKSLCPALAAEFRREIRINCIAKPELYAGKLCAALQRQHPRDLFDTMLLFKEGAELSKEIIDAFVIYLICQSRPFHELLNPNIKDIEKPFQNQFRGMTLDEVDVEELRDIQTVLPKKILHSLAPNTRKFLLGFKLGKVDWSLITHSDAASLPAVRWKQLNIEKMEISKRIDLVKSLQQVFDRHPK